MKNKSDLLWATLGEGGLILVISVIAWFARQPLIFSSLGPTAYEAAELPQMRSSRAYNVIVGHFVGLAAGFLALYVTGAWTAPHALTTGVVTPPRIWSMTIAVVLTTIVNLLLRSSQPAALATTLLVAEGSMQTERDAIAIILGVLLIALIGTPLRRFRLKHTRVRRAIEHFHDEPHQLQPS
ncbi:MAG TPA: HPP family protein [Candidatus Acidoferrales bacterium]|nr:HPP family protein [Candidatus Acidoferrales bacterium]